MNTPWSNNVIALSRPTAGEQEARKEGGGGRKEGQNEGI